MAGLNSEIGRKSRKASACGSSEEHIEGAARIAGKEKIKTGNQSHCESDNREHGTDQIGAAGWIKNAVKKVLAHLRCASFKTSIMWCVALGIYPGPSWSVKFLLAYGVSLAGAVFVATYDEKVPDTTLRQHLAPLRLSLMVGRVFLYILIVAFALGNHNLEYVMPELTWPLHGPVFFLVIMFGFLAAWTDVFRPKDGEDTA